MPTAGTSARAECAPLVFVEPSGYANRNIGDTAMLAVALERIRARWPNGDVRVHGLVPCELERLDPEATSVDPHGSRAWAADTMLAGRVRSLSRHADQFLEHTRGLRRRYPSLVRGMARTVLRMKGLPPALADDYLDNVRRCDLVVVTGGGTINDIFKRHAMVVLETLELAHESGAVTTIFGQGFGPMRDPALRRRAAAVLPRIDLIAVRERVSSLPLLESLGVERDRITVTGDDAIGLAWRHRVDGPGTAIGINVRVAHYSRVEHGMLESIARTVSAAAEDHGAPLVGLPVSFYPEEDDHGTLTKMFGPSLESACPRTALEIMAILSRCRIVVTGSYHVAVFALGTGIPAVTLASSEYYTNKFKGLVDLFGPDCRFETLHGSDLDHRLRTAIDAAMATAPEARDRLLAAAERQMVQGASAFERLASVVEKRFSPERS